MAEHRTPPPADDRVLACIPDDDASRFLRGRPWFAAWSPARQVSFYRFTVAFAAWSRQASPGARRALLRWFARGCRPEELAGGATDA